METITRSTKFDVFLSDSTKYKEVINSIRLYRMLCRKAFSACALAEMAGATVTVKKDTPFLKPNHEASKTILKEVFQGTPQDYKMHLYELRNLILKEETPRNPETGKSSWMSFVWDSLRGDVSTVWKAKDPSLPSLTKGWLLLQGARGIALFQKRGIGFPPQQKPEIAQHSLTLHWDHVMGPIEFKLGKLDGGRYHIWKGLRDNLPGWKLRTLYLSERDGKLFVTMAYESPSVKKNLDLNSILDITFTDNKDTFITLKGPGKLEGDFISAEEAIGLLEQIKIRHDRWNNRKKAAGNPRRVWGSKKIWVAVQDKIGRNSLHRENAIKDRNHLWTRRIVETAIRWNCGSIQINNTPDNFFGEPWKWSQFKTFLEYKIDEIGGKLVDFEPVSEGKKAVKATKKDKSIEKGKDHASI